MNSIGLNFDLIGELKLGQSKFGGNPDLPESLSYLILKVKTVMTFLSYAN